MFGQVDENGDERQAEHASRSQADYGARADWVGGREAPGAIDEGAVRVEELRGVRGFGEHTPRTIRDGAIVVERVVPELQRCEVEMDTANNCVGGVGAAGECDQVASVEHGHREGAGEPAPRQWNDDEIAGK